MVTVPKLLPVSLGNLGFALWKPGRVPGGKSLNNVGVPLKLQKFLILKSVHTNLQQFIKNNICIFLPVYDSKDFYSDKQISTVTLNFLVSPDFRAVVCLWPQSSDESKKSHWLSVPFCFAFFSCCNDRSKDFQALYMLEVILKFCFSKSWDLGTVI